VVNTFLNTFFNVRFFIHLIYLLNHETKIKSYLKKNYISHSHLFEIFFQKKVFIFDFITKSNKSI